jgi:hypothetical protein
VPPPLRARAARRAGGSRGAPPTRRRGGAGRSADAPRPLRGSAQAARTQHASCGGGAGHISTLAVKKRERGPEMTRVLQGTHIDIAYK